MTNQKLSVHLAQMFDAATTATSYIEGYGKEDFLNDKRTHQAVMLNILIIGEVATEIAQNYPEFAEANPNIPLSSMRNMRNRIAHGYFEIDFEVVWETVKMSVPPLIEALKDVRLA